MSNAIAKLEQQFKDAKYQISVTVFSIAMAWVLGLVIPTVFML